MPQHERELVLSLAVPLGLSCRSVLGREIQDVKGRKCHLALEFILSAWLKEAAADDLVADGRATRVAGSNAIDYELVMDAEHYQDGDSWTETFKLRLEPIGGKGMTSIAPMPKEHLYAFAEAMLSADQYTVFEREFKQEIDDCWPFTAMPGSGPGTMDRHTRFSKYVMWVLRIAQAGCATCLAPFIRRQGGILVADGSDHDHICTDDKVTQTTSQILAFSPWSNQHAVIGELCRLRAVHSSPLCHCRIHGGNRGARRKK